MSKLILIKDNIIIKYPCKISDLKKLLGNNVSLPSNPSYPFLYEDYQILEVLSTERPVDDIVSEIEPELIDGKYYEKFSSRSYTSEELSLIAERKLNELRSVRDNKLRDEIDTLNGIRWDLMDSIKKQEWTDYRQALLDVPQNYTCLDDVVWPVKPSEV